MATTSAPTGYAPVNGLNMYYEIHGTGQPLVLLHGAYMTIDSAFGKLLPTLAATRQVHRRRVAAACHIPTSPCCREPRTLG